jgi:hypothetical protein
MKFRNPETGEVYDNIYDARSPFCKKNRYRCGTCAISNLFQAEELLSDVRTCVGFCKEYSYEAARLMGYEVVEDENVLTKNDSKGESLEANMDKPRICEVLGVDVDEVFTIETPVRKSTYCRIDEEGKIYNTCIETLCYAINHPDRIIRKPRWTEQEVEDARAVKRLLEVDSVSRAAYGNGLFAVKNDWSVSIVLSRDCFPSLRPGETVTLDEIIGGAK